jgi:uncharacterized protein YsxB (DUF464 family)
MSQSRINSAYMQPTFIAAVVLLLGAALGLNVAVASLKLHFRKLAVPLSRPLIDVPAQLGDWVQVSRDEPIASDMEEVLGTDKYIFRDYLNVTARGGQCAAAFVAGLHYGETNEAIAKAGRDYIEAEPAQQRIILQNEMKDKTNIQRKTALSIAQREFPDAVVNMAITFYTGLADTVAHVPDRCYVADGFEPSDYTEPTWTLPNGRQIGVRFINFQDAGDRARPDRSVAYFFQVNGVYVSNPEAVRLRMQNLFQKYGYYLKVELMTMDQDHERSANTMTDFLNVSLAEVEKSYPDWNKYSVGSKAAGN